MGLLVAFLVITVIAALAVGWLVVCAIALVVRLSVRAIALPFRIARRADRALASRFAARAQPQFMKRGEAIQCAKSLCGARLPIEAKFCCRCGATVATRRAIVLPFVANVRPHRLSQVA